MIFLDFEASGIFGYPIQVGFCAVGADRAWKSAARLIRNDEWLDDFSRWDWQAEQLHQISRAELVANGEGPTTVLTWLNDELGGMVACVDSLKDLDWLRELTDAAGVVPAFRLEHVDAALDGPEIDHVADELDADRVAKRTHQADADAEHLAVRYVLSLRHGAPVHRLYVAGAGFERRPLPLP